MRASGSEFDVRAAQAEHGRHPGPEEAHRRRDPSSERRIRELGQRAGERVDLDEIAPDLGNQEQDALAVHSARS